MNKTKKVLALVMSLSMLAALTGCGGSRTADVTETEAAQTEQTTAASAENTDSAPAAQAQEIDASALIGHYDGALIMDEDGNMIDTDEEWLELGENGKAVLFLMDEPDEMTYDVYTDEDLILTAPDGTEVMGQYEGDWVYLSIQGLVLMLVKEGTPDWETRHDPKTIEAAQSETVGSDDDRGASAESGTDYNSIYSPVIDEISAAINDGYDFEKEYRYLPMGIVERIIYEDKSKLLRSIGYLIEDISGDGIPELLIGETKQDDTDEWSAATVYACYSYADGEIVSAFEGMTRSSHKYMGNGYFYYFGSNGAMSSLTGKNHISADGKELVWDDFYFTDGEDADTLSYYHNTTGFYDVDAAEKIDITHEDFMKIMDDYEKDIIQLPFIPIGGDTGSADGADGEIKIIDLPDGEMEGTWKDSAGNAVSLYEYRGEFEMGDSSGEIVYNGDPDAPQYTLRTYDGTDLAKMFFYKDADGKYCMSVTFTAPGGSTEVYRKQ